MSRPRLYHWWACHHGMPFDARWLVVAERAGRGVTPGHVAAVWTALLDHASQARPRGSVRSFDPASVAAFYRWPEDLIARVVKSLTDCGRIVDGIIPAFAARQAKDPTAAERKARQRSNERAAAAADPEPVEMSRDNHGNAVTSRDGHENDRDSHAYSTGHKSKSFQSGSSAQDHTSLTSINVDARASIGELWAGLESAGIPIGMIARMRNGQVLQGWERAGVTLAQLAEAIDRARRAREKQGDDSPLNVPYVSRFLEAVLSGKPDRTAGGFATADAAADEYLARSAR